jgi:predicted P-loop ATPase
LHDPSGSRRFWVVPVGKINLDRVKADRDRILAEAVVAFRVPSRWWLDEVEELRRAELVKRFSEVDPWEQQVLGYAEKQTYTRVGDVLEHVLNIPIERRDRRGEMRVGAILARNGFRSTQCRQDGQKGRFWHRPGK